MGALTLTMGMMFCCMVVLEYTFVRSADVAAGGLSLCSCGVGCCSPLCVCASCALSCSTSGGRMGHVRIINSLSSCLRDSSRHSYSQLMCSAPGRSFEEFQGFPFLDFHDAHLLRARHLLLALCGRYCARRQWRYVAVQRCAFFWIAGGWSEESVPIMPCYVITTGSPHISRSPGRLHLHPFRPHM